MPDLDTTRPHGPDLDDELRRAINELAEHAPVPPELDLLVEAAPVPTRRSPQRGRLVGAAALVIVVVAAAAVVATRHGDDATVVQSSLAPQRATMADVAGQTLSVRMGLDAAGSGFEMLYEFGRDASLTAADTPLPTGPLGPVYAQYLQPAPGSDPAVTDTTLPEPAAQAVGVVTVLPVERTDAVMAAAGHTEGVATTVNGHPALAVAAWSEHDDNAVTWEQGGVAVLVVGPATVGLDALEALAAEVAPVSAPVLAPPAAPDGTRPTSFAGYWSLAPDVPPVAPSQYLPLGATSWSVLRNAQVLSNALSTVVDHGTSPQGPFTVRAAGHPEMNGNLWPASPGGNLVTGALNWPSDTITVEVSFSADAGPDLIVGTTPTAVTQVRIRLSDGSIYLAPTYDVGRGWPVRIIVQPVPSIHGDNTATGLHAVHMDGLGADGTVLNSGPSTLGNGVPYGMAGYESILSCHPSDPTAFVFTDDCAQAAAGH